MPEDVSPQADLRAVIRSLTYADEDGLVRALVGKARLDPAARRAIVADAAELVERVRERSSPTVMEAFLAQYGLSTDEGVGLMCLAEALLRVPDAATIDELIADKIEPSNWGAHLGRSTSSLVNAATWGLLITGRVLDDDPGRPAAALRGMIRRLGEPVVRAAVGQAMKLMGRQFVLGETIDGAMDRARVLEAKGYTYSYDMLGEAARTDRDAERYAAAYARAIAAIGARARGDVAASPGISVKLSALHPRYEWTHRDDVMRVLLPRARALARAAAKAGIGFNIDAEEAERLELSLDVIEALLADEALAGWDGFGVVVQAYGRRAGGVIDWLDALARRLDRRLMVRLVKGAYWDSEIKQAQERGVPDFPVFTRKPSTDASYLGNARRLLDARDRLYPQFATHNAHTVAAVLALAGDRQGFEFQRLHGMGEALHEIVREREGTRCRIYAPVGAHRDLLAYLVRRLLENGANSSFVNQIVDKRLPAEAIAADPHAAVEAMAAIAHPDIRRPSALFAPRLNAVGWNVNEPASITALIEAREPWRTRRWQAAPMLAVPATGGAPRPVVNPADADDVVGEVIEAGAAEVAAALDAAEGGFEAWSARPAAERAAVLRRAADAYEANAAELTALATREAGKTLADAISEVREAVDFLRYYADAAEAATGAPRGVMVCISPWNFPLAIFTGQVAACLGAGNAVIAKPAEQTPLIAARATALLHAAGVPPAALQLLPGDGPRVGAPLTAAPGIAGVVFTGSTPVAQAIHRALAGNAAPDAVLIAETGGLNAMIVDSTALTEQVVRDVLASAFQSAGQRCSALRVLYVQDEARPRVMAMLSGAMEALTVGDPWEPSTDVGPVIDAEAEDGIKGYIAGEAVRGAVVKSLATPERGRFVPPTVVEVAGIGAVAREVFGPVLHVAGFRAERARPGGRRDQRPRLRADLRPAQPDRRPGRAGHGAAPRRQHLREPQPDRGRGRLAAVRRRGVERHRSQGGRAVLPAAPATAAGSRGRGRAWRRRRAGGGAGVGFRGARGRGWGARGIACGAGRTGRGGARGGRGAAVGARRPAGADRREQPAEPASAGAGALPRRGCRGAAGAGRAGAGRRQPGARGRRERAGGAEGPACGGARRADRSREPRRSRGSRAGRGCRARGLAPGAAPRARPAGRPDRAAGHRGAGAGTLRRRAAPLHRHHRGRRQRQPARGERLSRWRRCVPSRTGRCRRRSSRWSGRSR